MRKNSAIFRVSAAFLHWTLPPLLKGFFLSNHQLLCSLTVTAKKAEYLAHTSKTCHICLFPSTNIHVKTGQQVFKPEIVTFEIWYNPQSAKIMVDRN